MEDILKLLISIVTLCSAPLIGAVKAIHQELTRPKTVYPTFSARIKDSIRIYFAPLTGAIRETRRQLDQLIKQDD